MRADHQKEPPNCCRLGRLLSAHRWQLRHKPLGRYEVKFLHPRIVQPSLVGWGAAPLGISIGAVNASTLLGMTTSGTIGGEQHAVFLPLVRRYGGIPLKSMETEH